MRHVDDPRGPGRGLAAPIVLVLCSVGVATLGAGLPTWAFVVLVMLSLALVVAVHRRFDRRRW